MKRKTLFTHHALERVCERYGARFSKKQQLAFERILSNPKFTIPLTGNRLACYFEGKWYLLACNTPTGTLRTFLRPEDASEEEKYILSHDARYLKINNDAFRVLPMPQRKSTELPPQVKRMIPLPTDSLTEDELQHDEIQWTESILKKICD